MESTELSLLREQQNTSRDKEEKKSSLKVGRKVIIMRSQYRKSLKAREEGELL